MLPHEVGRIVSGWSRGRRCPPSPDRASAPVTLAGSKHYARHEQALFARSRTRCPAAPVKRAGHFVETPSRCVKPASTAAGQAPWPRRASRSESPLRQRSRPCGRSRSALWQARCRSFSREASSRSSARETHEEHEEEECRAGRPGPVDRRLRPVAELRRGRGQDGGSVRPRSREDPRGPETLLARAPIRGGFDEATSAAAATRTGDGRQGSAAGGTARSPQSTRPPLRRGRRRRRRLDADPPTAGDSAGCRRRETRPSPGPLRARPCSSRSASYPWAATST